MLSFNLRGWLTTPSWPEALDDHPEWRAESPSTTSSAPSTSSLLTRIISAMGASIAIIPGFTPAGVQVASGMLASNEEVEDDEDDGEVRNTGPVYFLTAVERAWYHERGLETPVEGWTLCTEGDRVFDYRLEEGVWELEVVPGYDEDVKTRA